MITPSKPKISLKEIVKLPVSEWRGVMKNDFEAPVFKKFSQICILKQKLYELGSLNSSLRGSGTSIFGIFDKLPELNDEFKNNFVWGPHFSLIKTKPHLKY